MRNPLRAYFVWWHGEGADHQKDTFRCLLCTRIVTWNMIRSGGCRCGGSRIRPARPYLGETLALLLTPWRFRATHD